jgi:hypothetical protein
MAKRLTKTSLTEMLDEGITEVSVPSRMLPSLYAYIVDGRPPGSFLEAIITNDLHAAFALADDENVQCLAAWTQLLYQWAPSESWGSKATMTRWIAAQQDEHED